MILSFSESFVCTCMYKCVFVTSKELFIHLTKMATLELDPVFVKALRLLHSKAKDSAAQLRTMVDDAIAARKLKVTASTLYFLLK